MHVLVADDHDLVREAFTHVLENTGDITVTQASTVAEVLLKLEELSPDIVLLDYDMPGMQGLQGFKKTLESAGSTPIALMSGVASVEIAEQALDYGAAGFIPKTLGVRAIVGAINLMLLGEQFAPIRWMREAQSAGVTPDPDVVLTAREMQVLAGLREGKSNKEIARDLELQEVTIKLYMKSLMQKLGARNRTHAALLGKQKGIIER
ncbi:response regulator transcription factor [Sulfitobacter sp. R18_1]|uniref:response regulator transcription factor n=1 Tax=Sulfitobacter sp. R18_1 TaxID=2821104 RepID=UPI001ADBC340|nr:response regulator transcription factor [Sulfitobacter sp. R18_1]MBO9432320.1 response regulator transcription factor [Sulfitobacter sp. R18_1]